MKPYWESYPSLANEPTLLIHGNLASTIWWRPFVEEWKRQGALGTQPILAADWRGCGQNPDWPADKEVSIADLAGDYLELLETQKIKRANVVAHSLGGLIALKMMILAPQCIGRVVLLDPVGAKGVVFDESMYEAFRQMAKNSDLTKTVILSTVRNAEHLPEDFRAEIGRDAFKAVKGLGSSVLEILKTVDFTQEARHIQSPTLILHGEHDAVISQDSSEHLAQLIPRARLEIKKGVGHCWNVEDPKAFTSRVREWLSQVVI